jgi:tetratricopeptide (TPR) repeat protein
MAADPARPSRRAQAIGCALLILVVALVYLPGRRGGFAFDDFPNIVDNAAVHVQSLAPADWLAAAASSPARSLPRPLAMLSFAANHYVSGGDSTALKLTNIAIHLVNVVLVFLLSRRLLTMAGASTRAGPAAPGWIGLGVAAAWGLHPINLMPVLLIVQRMESLAHVFVFAGLIAYLAGRERQRRGERGAGLLGVALLLCPFVGSLSKESAALLPLFCFLAEACLFRFETVPGRRDRKLLLAHGLLVLLPAVLAFAWLLQRSLAPGAFASRNFDMVERLMTEARVVFDYLRWIVLPDLRVLSLYHDDYVVSRGLLQPASTLPAMLALPLCVAAAWWLRTRRPLTALGLLWFFAAQALTATIVPLELVFEHRNYFASLGVLLALADLLLLVPSNARARRICAVAGASAIVVLGTLTALRAREWSDPVAFAFAEAQKHPDSPRAVYYLGWVLTAASKYQPDSPYVQPALDAFERARRLPDANALPDSGSLLLAARTGRPLDPAWWRHMQQRLARGPIGPQETSSLAVLVNCDIKGYCRFPPADMLATFGAALSRGPNAEVYNIYANYVWNAAGDHELGLRLWQEAKRIQPAESQYHISVIRALTVLGRREEARKEIRVLRNMGRLRPYAAKADALEAALGPP